MIAGCMTTEKEIKAKELHVSSDEAVFKQLAEVLVPLREKEQCSQLFIVEGMLANPRIGIRYPGRKLVQRALKNPKRKGAVLWANLLDFEVVPFVKGKEQSSRLFTYRNLLKDFEMHKKDEAVFWSFLEQLCTHNTIPEVLPALRGIETRQFLEMLKWMWIQEDVNYRLSWEETKSSIPYTLQNRSGTSTKKGAGRFKFFAALLLVKHHGFSAEMAGRIIP